MIYHIIAFSIGVIGDFIIGDPYWLPHPIRWIGRFILFLDKKMMDYCMVENKRDTRKERRKGILTVCLVTGLTLLCTALILVLSYIINTCFGIIIEAVLTCYTLAATSLKKESMKVFKELKKGNIEGARKAVSMIVGRDTENLDETGIAKAAVETVAENTSDGVIAPMIYLIFGGPILGMGYKAVNTMDSMIGYHNERYESFGKAAAKLDDILNYIPARLTAIFMIVAAIMHPKCDSINAWKIFVRDRYNHKSPNSAQTESVCAGALSVQLAGDASYFGKIVKKPFIGEAIRKIEIEDIKIANQLMYITASIIWVLGEIFMLAIALTV